MSALVESLANALSSGSALALPIALAGGVLVGLNPCCLAFYPALAASCCATTVADRARTGWAAAALVAGTASATTLMGLLATLAGHAMGAFGRGPRYALAFVPLVMGSHLIGWLRLPLPTARATRGIRLASAFSAGFLLAFLVGSCGTPVLAAILAYVAYQGKLLFGATLLSAYGIGTGLPLLAAAIGADELARTAVTAAPWVERAAGLVLLGLGYYLILTVA